jgi:hypothetical protein
MLSIDNTTDTVRAVMAAAVTTTAPDYYVTYVDVTTTGYSPAENHGALNGVTAVNIAGSPAASTQRVVKYISIFNRDTVAHAITVTHWDTSIDYRLWVGTLQPNETLQFTDMLGWSVIDAFGIPKASGQLGIAAVAANGVTLSTGTAVLSNSNGVSFSANGNTLDIAHGPILSNWGSCVGTGGAQTISNALPAIYPFYLHQPISGTKMDMVANWAVAANAASSATHSFSISVGIYSERTAGIMQLYTSTSVSSSYSYSSTTNTTNLINYRVLTTPFNMSLSQGQWWMMFHSRSSTGGNALTFSVSWLLHGGDIAQAPNGYLGVIRFETQQFRQGMGYLSNTSFTTRMPDEISMNIIQHGSVARYVRPVVIGFEA